MSVSVKAFVQSGVQGALVWDPEGVVTYNSLSDCPISLSVVYFITPYIHTRRLHATCPIPGCGGAGWSTASAATAEWPAGRPSTADGR